MSDLDDFLNETLARQVNAEEALHNGDPEPRLAMWSAQDPVTLFGAATSQSGAEQVRRFFRKLAAQFSDCAAYRFELVAAGVSGDLAYTVGYEHTSVSIDGTPGRSLHPARHPPLPSRGRRLEDRPPPWRPSPG
jgi:ketosteroid isomerase-like protein